jgi:hypothetical protein
MRDHLMATTFAPLTRLQKTDISEFESSHPSHGLSLSKSSGGPVSMESGPMLRRFDAALEAAA